MPEEETESREEVRGPGRRWLRTRMNELKMGGMKSYARDAASSASAGWYFLSPMTRMADGGELHTDLVLQSGDEGDPDERSGAQTAFDRIAKFSAGGFMSEAVVRHWNFPGAKVVTSVPCLAARCPRTTARYCLTGVWARNCWTSGVAIGVGLAKSRTPDLKRSMRWTTKHVAFSFQFGGKQRPCGRGVGAFDGDGGKSGGLLMAITASFRRARRRSREGVEFGDSDFRDGSRAGVSVFSYCCENCDALIARPCKKRKSGAPL